MIRSLVTNLLSNALNWDVFENKQKKINLEKKKMIFFSIFESLKSPLSEKEKVRFPDGPDFENLLDFRTGRDVR